MPGSKLIDRLWEYCFAEFHTWLKMKKILIIGMIHFVMLTVVNGNVFLRKVVDHLCCILVIELSEI